MSGLFKHRTQIGPLNRNLQCEPNSHTSESAPLYLPPRFWLVATRKSSGGPNTGVAERHHEGDGHDHSSGEHSHTGPHDGHLIELGSDEAFHAELIHDDKTHRVTIFILDGKAKNNVPIPQPELAVNIVNGGNPKQFKLAAVSQANELRDMASCFQLENEELCTALCCD